MQKYGSWYTGMQHSDDWFNKFSPVALAELPMMFGLKELAKGFFPHLFNRRENQDIVMSHPPNIKYYDADSMMTDPTRASNRKSFLEWYDTHKNDTFNFNKELLRYCRSDVDILRCCCLKFRDLFFEIKYERNGGTDHFAHFITIALACNLVFRKKFLNPETIGIIRIHGYRPYEKHSMKALK